MNKQSSFGLSIDKFFTRFGMGMRAKLITLFVIIKVLPLIILACVAYYSAWKLGQEVTGRAQEISSMAHNALATTETLVVDDAVEALDNRAREDIERMTTDTALAVARFLYHRDDDTRSASSLQVTESAYRQFIVTKIGRVVKPSLWALNEAGNKWEPKYPRVAQRAITSSLAENDNNFHYRPPEDFVYEDRPLFLEMTFVDLSGHEKIKITTSPLMDKRLKNVSDKRNTFVRAETYFEQLKDLKPGEIYVSDVIGEYIGSKIIGAYTPESTKKLGIPFTPEESAYAGIENPVGKKFKGLIRWATPVVEHGKIIGYVTLALDHDHIMEFTSHLMPTVERYTELPDASDGNYAFIWDYKGRSIAHPRHFSIAGYNRETGEPQVPWLEDRIYDAWQNSGLPYTDFIADQPTFVNQSNSNKPAKELTEAGMVGLDCRYLNFAPQCKGWFDLTEEGGSGSFVIHWSGLWKLNTAATIPYYTGHYGESMRGFGFVTIGANMRDFHRTATETGDKIKRIISKTDADLQSIAERTYAAIKQNIFETATGLAISTVLMALLVILIAIWMASVFTRRITSLINGIYTFMSGHRGFRFNSPIKDEMGMLAESFDDMAESIVASESSTLLILDLSRTIIYANEAALELMGKSWEEVVGKKYWDITIFPPKSEYCAITALRNGTEATEMFYERDMRYYKAKAQYLLNPSGENIGLLITTTNVTSLVLEKKNAEEQRALLDSIFASSPDIMAYKGTDGRYLMVNKRLCEVFRKSEDEIIGKDALEILPPDVARKSEELDAEAITKGTFVYSEERYQFIDGQTRVLEIVRSPLYSETGELQGILSVARDVSERVKVEEELRSTQNKLEQAVIEANKASMYKSSFLARMSHEIRTPMNAIIGMSGIIKRKISSTDIPVDEVQTHVKQIESSSQHLLGLLNDVLDISKVEAGKIEISHEAFNLSRLVKNVSSIIEPRCVEKNIEFTINCTDYPEQAAFEGDPLRLRQVLINLLGNAVKFTPECGTITFMVKKLDQVANKHHIHFEVADTGIGIEAHSIEKLFLPFEQANETITKNFGGTGLGLSISKSILKLMGSDIQVQSEHGAGSTFSFDIWFEAIEEEEQIVESSTNKEFLRGKRILLVDDVDINRIIVMEQLSTLGILIDEAENGKDAVEKFTASEDGTYDFILMDVQMPIMDGHSATRAIRALDRPDVSLPIIAMTANAFKEDVDAAVAAGMNAHIAKPFDTEKLIGILLHFSEHNTGSMFVH